MAKAKSKPAARSANKSPKVKAQIKDPTNQVVETEPSASADSPPFQIITSRHFISWLVGQGISLAFTTYQASKLFLLGVKSSPENPNGELTISERTIERCMGITAIDRSLYVAAKWQIWRFENACQPGIKASGFDAIYVPKSSHVTGDVDCHEMAVDADGRLVFVNTLFNCLSYMSRDFSFHPVWRPPFITAYAAEDRCHMNGLAMQDGKPAYVSVVAETDVVDGWRDRRDGGGIIIDVRTNEIVCTGLSMPHSPRLHEGTLWVQNSGTGYLGRVNMKKGTFEPVTFCPGFLRGMTIVGNFAICAVSKAREGHSFSGMSLEDNLKAKNADPRCGLLVIDLSSGNILHWIRIEGLVTELFGVTALPGIMTPRAIGFKSDEISRTISLPPDIG